MSDTEKKKEWISNRIDKILVAIRGQFKEQEEEFVIESNKIIHAQREIQKTILILLGIGITIILGINSQSSIPNNIFVNILTGFTITMLFMFIASLIYDYYLSRFFNKIRNAYKFQIGDISQVIGDFLHTSTEIENYEYKQFQTYVRFCWVLSSSAQVITLRAYEYLNNSNQRYKSLRKYSKSRIDQIKYNLDLGISNYDSYSKEFQNEELLERVINRLNPLVEYKTQRNESKKN